MRNIFPTYSERIRYAMRERDLKDVPELARMISDLKDVPNEMRITADTRAIERAIRNHIGSATPPNTKYIYAYSVVLDCDTDFLMGLSPRLKKEHIAACEETFFSEKAVDGLHWLHEVSPYREHVLLDLLLQHPDKGFLLPLLANCCEYLGNYSPYQWELLKEASSGNYSIFDSTRLAREAGLDHSEVMIAKSLLNITDYLKEISGEWDSVQKELSDQADNDMM